jgi:hypothetical protein
MLKKIALAVVALVALFAVVVALQPAAFHIARSITIQAPASAVYPRIESLHAQNAWSPWSRTDPKMIITYDGPFAGVGAKSAWDGPTAGKGRATITAVTPDREVRQTVEFLAPMQATNQVVFTLAPSGDATTVTWSMDGTNGFIGKAFALALNIDKLVGDDFDKGLATLKAQVETGASPPPS